MMLWSLLFIFGIFGAEGENASEALDCQTPQKTVPGTPECNAGNVNLTNKISSQSSTYTDSNIIYSSDRAVDGNYSTCSVTSESQSWWKIDLQGFYNISCISIFNKKPADHTNLTDVQIFIGNWNNSNTTVQVIKNFTECASNVYTFTPTVGRYITMCFPPKTGILCEVNITGTEEESPFVLIKQKLIWEDALYYCRENYMNLASILDEEAQAFAELEAENADTDYVWLGLHYTCTLHFWFWVDNNAVKFQRWYENSNAENCDMSGVMMKNQSHFWDRKSDYEMYNFICAK